LTPISAARRNAKKRWTERNREKYLEMMQSSRRRRYWRRKREGVCTECGGALLSESLCWDCLNRLEEARVIRI
jgi:hypothetical protein